jgi:hypothetical protein
MFDKLTQYLFALILLLFGLFSNLYAQSESDAYRVETFRTGATPEVDISTSGGFVRVYGGSESEVKVVMYVRRGSRWLSPSDTDLSDFDVEISRDGDRITAYARNNRSGVGGFFRSDRNLSVSFEVHMPENSTVTGNTSGGSVTAENLSSKTELRTSGGSVTAKNLSGISRLQTSGGSITLDNVYGDINARTSGGSVRASDISGTADLRTSGGSIRIENATGKISARTSGGSIRAQFAGFDEDIELSTSGGSIRVEVPRTEHFSLDLAGSRVQTELRNFTGTTERNRIRGDIGNGGPVLRARTSGGGVEVLYN